MAKPTYTDDGDLLDDGFDMIPPHLHLIKGFLPQGSEVLLSLDPIYL
ncbi:hypothetical protein HanLR1_Chr12g0432671 [Helianthus annuus]|nr:hypothetical protein HanLR1_Chr12g0432641 [Helianthus annuus]KAJ0673769.1 hypothetical protein HanLR1_Chr12g0432671 [Helianthus annuus]